MRAVYEEEALTEKALLKHLDGKAAVVSAPEPAPAAVVSAPEPAPGRDLEPESFFFKGISGMGTLLFKVTANVRSPAPHRHARPPPIGPPPHRHARPHVGSSPPWAARLSLGMVRCVVCVPSQMQGEPNPDVPGKPYGPNVYKCQRYDIGGDKAKTTMQV